jgi:hypothetical protein
MAQTGFTPISIYYSATATNVPTAGNLVAGELAINTADGKLFYKDSSGVVQTIASKDTSAGTFTSITDSGNLTFTGTGNRIRGDMSNATTTNRLAFQTSTTNGNTALNVIPNGTAVTASFVLHNNSDPDNASRLRFSQGSASSIIASDLTGTGTYVPMSFFTGGSERIRIDTSGNVGIGLTSLSNKFQVTTDSAAQTVVFNTTTSGTSSLNVSGYDSTTYSGAGFITGGARIILQNLAAVENTYTSIYNADRGGNSNAGINFCNLTDATNGGFLTFATRPSSGSSAERMRIDENGNVGIGTTGPNRKLGVTDTVAAGVGGIVAVNTATDGFSAVNIGDTTAGILRNGSAQSAYAGANSLSLYTLNANPIGFVTNNLERMRIDSSGNVGIGTISPTSYNSIANQLVLSRTGTDTGLTIASGTASGGNIFFADGTTGTDPYRGFIQYVHTSDYMNLGTAGTERMRIDSSGNLLVGTSTLNGAGGLSIYPNNSEGSALVTFYRTARTTTSFPLAFYDGTTNVGSISFTNLATLYNTTSDYRLKNVVGVIADAGQRIDALKPIEYDWNTGGRTRGFLAHQFAEVYPDSVTGEKDAVDEEGKPKYQAMQASTSEVMADLIAEIQSLRKRVAQLESK